MIDQFITFFERPGINKAGICLEIGVSQQHLNAVLAKRKPLTKKLEKRVIPILKQYGFKPI